VSCKDEWKAEVTSNTSWRGQIGGSTQNGDLTSTSVEGSGNRTVDLGSEKRVCCAFKKTTASGYLKVKIKNEAFLGTDGPEAETSVSFGLVELCTQSGQ
jgi:hypothetical protein